MVIALAVIGDDGEDDHNYEDGVDSMVKICIVHDVSIIRPLHLIVYTCVIFIGIAFLFNLSSFFIKCLIFDCQRE